MKSVLKFFGVLLLGVLLGVGGQQTWSGLMEKRSDMLVYSDIREFSGLIAQNAVDNDEVFPDRSVALQDADLKRFLSDVMYLPLPGTKISQKRGERRFVAWSHAKESTTGKRLFVLTNFIVEFATDDQVDWVTQELKVIR